MRAKIKGLLQNDVFVGALLALCAFLVYLTTLGPSIGFIDAGELAAVAYSFGVAHPTGYPLFTLLAGIFSHLPLGGSVIWKLNLLAAIWCAVAVFLWHRVFLRLLPVREDGPAAPRRLAAATGVLILAFSRTFWSQSVGVEVYSLHLLMIGLVLLLFLRALPEGGLTGSGPFRGLRDPAPRQRRWFLFAFALGLGFTNHMTTLLVLPALFYGYFSVHGFSRLSWKNAGLSAPFFLAGLLPYLYLPLRAATIPPLSWGAIVDRDSFYAHISGKQYAGWMFSSLEPAGRQFKLFLATWPSEFGYLPLIPALIGLVVLFRFSRRLFVFSLLLFWGCLLYAINYDISDVVNYFLLAYIATALWITVGIRALLEAAMRRKIFAPAVAGCVLCVLLPLGLHYREVDESGNYGVEDYARNVLTPLEPGAVLFTTQWDHLVAGAWYLQIVEGVRPDVTVIDRELLKRSWYVRYLSQRHPDILAAAGAEVPAFLREVAPFERGEPYSGALIQARFEGMVRAMAENNSATRPVYATPEVDQAYLGRLQKVPEGAVFHLYRQKPAGYAPRDLPHRPFPKDNVYFRVLRGFYANASVNQGIYLGSQFDDLDGCERFLRKALLEDPGSVAATQWLERLRAERLRRATPR